MKAIVIPEPGRVEVKELPMVERREGEAVLKLLYGGVCGSDLGTPSDEPPSPSPAGVPALPPQPVTAVTAINAANPTANSLFFFIISFLSSCM